MTTWYEQGKNTTTWSDASQQTTTFGTVNQDTRAYSDVKTTIGGDTYYNEAILYDADQVYGGESSTTTDFYTVNKQTTTWS